ncbi:hypothetical protein COV56_02130 [Candidatus Kuenenbacteria bacterium CG11_big_fil_rev_8_21_14_0_20_37_9]|nr:MAG: hypothetical protein COV56_02130 [Candidatus Kuenenbacteria bacterium CG11_big_fil_rev_8_21_14_0_20_37_9]
MPIVNPKKRRFYSFFIFLVISLLLNFVGPQNAILGLILGILWLIWASKIIGNRFFPGEQHILQFTAGLAFLLIVIILISLLFFYFINFQTLSIVSIFIIVSSVCFLFDYYKKSNSRGLFASAFKIFCILKCFSLKGMFAKVCLAATYLILYLISFAYLFSYSTSNSLLSPWEILPKKFFIIYFLLNITLFAIILRKDKSNCKVPNARYPRLEIIFLSLHFFLACSIAVIIYKIGFGFDPFVHRASENALANLGYLMPRPLYYIGQYALVVFLSKILFIKIIAIDKLLVPLLASLLLPASVFYSINKIFKNKKLIILITACCLPLTAYCFFYTVPQSLANLLLLILILMSIPYFINNGKLPCNLWLIALATMFIHPLAGIPAFIYLGFIVLWSNNFMVLRFYGSIIFSLLAGIAIPLFFFFASIISSDFNIVFQLSNISSVFNIFDAPRYLPFYSIYHLIYLYKFNIGILLILIFIVGSYFLYKKNKTKFLAANYCLLTILFANLIILSLIQFNSIIDYEQREFAKRLLYVIFFFSLPIILSGIYSISLKILQFKKGNLLLIILISAINVITLYISYPVVDAFEKNRGYSVSRYDIQAVNWINEDSTDKDYIVLANQSTSAAALQEFGFKKYYNSKIQNLFYYPIPTSSPLYDIYLKMVYDEPKLKYINTARELTGVKTVYFVINDYWLDFKKRVEQAELIANRIKNINNKIWVFKFE